MAQGEGGPHHRPHQPQHPVLPGPLRKPPTRPASSRADTADDVSASLAASSAPTSAGRRTTPADDLAADVDSLISTCNYLSHEKQVTSALKGIAHSSCQNNDLQVHAKVSPSLWSKCEDHANHWALAAVLCVTCDLCSSPLLC